MALQSQSTYDHGPSKPTGLAVDTVACTNKPLVAFNQDVRLSATFADPDNGSVTPQFQWWPTKDPGHRTNITSGAVASATTGTTTISRSALADETTYAWRTRGSDGSQTGPWSETCLFSTDFSTPNNPTVTSTVYPSGAFGGGTGIPGTFTFGPSGSTDIIGYYYGTTDPRQNFVAADHIGGSATIQFTPTSDGPSELLVESVNKAQTPSAQVTYEFFVNDNAPTVTCTPASGFIGVPRQCALSPFAGETGVQGYVYQFDNGPVTAIPAGPDGTAGVTVTPQGTGGNSFLSVRTKLSSGNLSAANSVVIPADPGRPTVSQSATNVAAGTPVQFTFTAILPGSMSFTYTVSNGAPVTVPVGTDGTATITATPTVEGIMDVNVHSTTAAGLNSGSSDGIVFVSTDRPNVSSTQYPANSNTGEPGVPGTFTFSSPAPGAVSYTYAFNGATPVTVPAAADGTAAVSLAPSASGAQILLVTSTLSNGIVSEQTRYEFDLNNAEPSVGCPQGFVGQQVQCTATPQQANVVSYVYSFNGGPNTTVAAAADGTATITVTAPATPGSYFLTVSSVDADGTVSETGGTGVDVANPSS